MVFRNLRFLCVPVLLVFLIPSPVRAQRGGRGQPPATARQAAALDVTGYWVSVIMEDWKFRMVTPKKGVYDTLTLNAEGRRIGDAWDPARDEAAGEQCKLGKTTILSVSTPMPEPRLACFISVRRPRPLENRPGRDIPLPNGNMLQEAAAHNPGSAI
ncbi:MAG: hypothetical protein DMG11_32195 [Acidobacteria bacterium]|nr:MAG: hypothetical protein DMG11_32195 [Acidobacteriota bacterium]